MAAERMALIGSQVAGGLSAGLAGALWGDGSTLTVGLFVWSAVAWLVNTCVLAFRKSPREVP